MTAIAVAVFFWMVTLIPFGFIYYLAIAIESIKAFFVVWLIHSAIVITIVSHSGS